MLETAEIPYKVKGKFQAGFYIGGRLEFDNITNITVEKKDFDRATLLCLNLIEKEKQIKEKWAQSKPTLMEKFISFLRLW